MQESIVIELEKLFLALSDKTRLRLLALMANGEVSVGFLADKLGESQPKISRHLAYLRTAGLVSTRRDGKWVYYGIEDIGDASVRTVLDTTLRSIMPSDADRYVSNVPGGDGYESYDASPDISAEPYIDDWHPTEMEIYLL